MIQRLFLLLFLLKSSAIYAQQVIPASGISSNIFIKNHGQIVNQFGLMNADVLYMYNDGNFNLQIKRNGFSYELFQVQQEETIMNESGGFSEPLDEYALSYRDAAMNSSRIDVTFPGSNTQCVIEAGEKTDAYFNFYYAPISTNAVTDVGAYRKITYRNLYDGIDLVFYAPEKNSSIPLRYEFVVHPFADYSKIKFSYAGTSGLYKDKAGNFVASNSLGFVSESKPYFIVEDNEQHSSPATKAVAGNFILKKNIKSFSAYNYNREKFLIIDPNIFWGTYYGGLGGDEVAEVSVGSDLKPVISGHTISQFHIATTDGYQTSYGGGLYDLFVAKFKEDGNLQWGTYFGGNDKDYGYGVTVDHQNNIIAIGNAQSQGLATPGAFKESVSGPNADILIAKFGPAGNLIWSTYYGGSGPENPRNVVADFKGDIYLSGTTGSDTGIATIGAHQTEKNGYDDSWIAKFSHNGNRLWASYFGDSGVDRSHSIILDLFGNVYDGGTTSSKKGIATPGAQQTVYGGKIADAYIAKWDTGGFLIWASYCGGPEDDKCRGVETDSEGNVYLSGFTASDTLIATPDGFQPQWSVGYLGSNPTYDAYLVKYNAQGVRQWGTYYGGTKDENMWGMVLDKPLNAIYMAGYTASLTNIAYYNPLQSTNGGNADCFLAKFKTDGSLEWGTYYGGKGSEQFEDVAVDTFHNIYACARATSNSMKVTSGTYQTYFFGGYSDAALIKFYPGFDCFDNYEPNESMAAAKELKSYLVSDSVVYGYAAGVANANDADWFRVSVETGFQNLRIILSALPKNYDLNLYDELGILLFQSSKSGLIPDTISVNSLATGTYFFEVAHLISNFDSLHCYRIELFKSDSAFKDGEIYSTVSVKNKSLSFPVYPNPSENILSFEIPSSATSNEVMVYDLCGRLKMLKSFQGSSESQITHINISELSSGPYTIMLKSADQIRISRFVKNQ